MSLADALHPLTYAPLAEAVSGRSRGSADLSALLAPPYDVLDEAAKHTLCAKDRHNIASIDLPHLPAKQLGPPEAYDRAGDLYRRWASEGVLKRLDAPALVVMRQTFTHTGTDGVDRCLQRLGVWASVELLEFGQRGHGGGRVLPHEQTFAGPKEDRLALMKATAAQLSPVFGIYPDPGGQGADWAARVANGQPPHARADLGDGVVIELWVVQDSERIERYRGELAAQDVIIADGHHRYTTQVDYLRFFESFSEVPADHPARRCMMVLVSMHDPGLVIWPTHRVVGGMAAYSVARLLVAAQPWFQFTDVAGGLDDLERALNHAEPGTAGIAFGLADLASGRQWVAVATSPDPLAALGGEFAGKPASWRTLDVAVIQHVLVDRICRPALNAGQDVSLTFSHTLAEVRASGSAAASGQGPAQLAVILRATPLSAVIEASRAGVLMPQKSTFFYPKLPTGVCIHTLAR